MPKFTVWVQTDGRAEITAPTKRAAEEKALRGEFDNYRLVQPPVAHISTLKRSEA
jgi:hypothetical protein